MERNRGKMIDNLRTSEINFFQQMKKTNKMGRSGTINEQQQKLICIFLLSEMSIRRSADLIIDKSESEVFMLMFNHEKKNNCLFFRISN